ncbi:hypothetical protein HGRIS_005750 [Hohenbuehelia grisea]|uniref:Cytochrome P450 n=1 Tax=Hohenbuehelia grisea TaxID=104357 RepID=A0ABR3JXR3_9AGAR
MDFALVALIVVLTYLIHRLLKPRRVLLPPGPIGLPLVGNILDLPTVQPWNGFADLGKKYGGIIHLKALSQSIIILNDPRHAFEMLERRSRTYSDRPTLTMAGTLVGWEQAPVLMPLSKPFTEHRRSFAQFMGSPAKVVRFNDTIAQKTRTFLGDILRDPDHWVDHITRLSGSIMLSLTFGYDTKNGKDPMIGVVNKAMDQFSELTAPNAFLVDIFPFRTLNIAVPKFSCYLC